MSTSFIISMELNLLPRPQAEHLPTPHCLVEMVSQVDRHLKHSTTHLLHPYLQLLETSGLAEVHTQSVIKETATDAARVQVPQIEGAAT